MKNATKSMLYGLGQLLVLISLLIAAGCEAPLSMSTENSVLAKAVAPDWTIGVSYKVGDVVTYQGVTYTCQTPNTAIAGWEPPVVPALWVAGGTPSTTPAPTATPTPTPTPSTTATATPTPTPTPTTTSTATPTPTPTPVVTPTPTPVPSGSAPAWTIGVTYAIGNVVTYLGNTYTCQTPNTAQVGWEPTNAPALWVLSSGATPTPTPTSATPTPTPTPTPTTSTGVTPTPTPSPTTTTNGGLLTDAQIQAKYGGINPAYLPSAVANNVQNLLSQSTYETLFPYRHGSAGWSSYNGNAPIDDYYSYANLKAAVQDLANVMVVIETQSYTQKVSRLNKTTKIEVIVKQDPDFGASWLASTPVVTQIVDYGKFLSEGTSAQKKQDLCALLGNISHETTGGWSTAPGGEYAWGLYFNEEVGYNDSSVGAYVAASTDYPAVAGQSYHGRGPIQLSYNYNYGYMSEIVYGDKNTLLNNPKLVAHDGKLGFETAIWFWMTPQSPKPAAHDVMVGTWTPTAADIAANRLPGFGTTINIVNGGLEAGHPGDARVANRIGFYTKYCGALGVDPGPNLDCGNQTHF